MMKLFELRGIHHQMRFLIFNKLYTVFIQTLNPIFMFVFIVMQTVTEEE